MGAGANLKRGYMQGWSIVNLQSNYCCREPTELVQHFAYRGSSHQCKGAAIVIKGYGDTSGFLPRVRARALRAPVFLGLLPRLMRRCAPPAHRSFAAPPKIKKPTISRIKMLPFWPELEPPVAYIFHWATLHPTELHCILLSYGAPF